jgi:hypothetical protein
VGVVLVIFIGMGGFNPLNLTPVEAIQMFFFWTTCVAMLAAWRWDLIGGAISTASILLFFAVEFSLTGRFPKGVVFNLMWLPGFLFVVSGLMKRHTSATWWS